VCTCALLVRERSGLLPWMYLLSASIIDQAHAVILAEDN
jgi:hypothetical protein